jgi:hypothetical protein
MVQVPREPLLPHFHPLEIRLGGEAYSHILAKHEADLKSASLLTTLCSLRPVTTAEGLRSVRIEKTTWRAQACCSSFDIVRFMRILVPSVPASALPPGVGGQGLTATPTNAVRVLRCPSTTNAVLAVTRGKT